MSKVLEVVVGLIGKHKTHHPFQTIDYEEYLLSQRSPKQSFAGLWEFPGGKIEQKESPLCALQRELMEELGINIDTQSCQKLMLIPWRYDDLHINLHIYQVHHYALSPYSAENQKIAWWKKTDITSSILPPANRGLVGAISLPPCYAISGMASSPQDFLQKTQNASTKGVKLLQIRMPFPQWKEWNRDKDFIKQLKSIMKRSNCRMLLNSQCVEGIDKAEVPLENWRFSEDLEGFSGWHIRAGDLTKKKLSKAVKHYSNYLWGSSVHNEEELLMSENIGVNFMCISPILPISSDPSKKPLGFEQTKRLLQLSATPVYYLGGMNLLHLPYIQQNQAMGIAGISNFWD
jgi:8-oxo-dGTP diphosphatase